ncbi:MAG: tetratricopeptide repeat protein [Flavobacteriaceae bacterium]|nr:tetratricopeptide repeat protein [Flavobacteriaceae bacterium]
MVMVLFMFFSEISFAQNQALFNQAKQQYKSEKYQEAITNWMKILQSGEHSSALYFNIANAHYKLNSVGPSIYYYEKALQLSPNDSEILNNLTFAQNTTIDAIEPLPKTIFAKWNHTISSWLTFDGWAWTTVVFAALFALLFLLYYFAVYSTRKRLFFIGSMVSLIVLLVSLSMSFRTYNQQSIDLHAIIFAESVDVKSDPSKKSETSFVLHEGTKVKILSKDEDWYRIQIADGKGGWLLNDQLKEL